MPVRGRVGGRQGPGLVRTAAKTAVIAGTATATVGAVHHAMGGGKQPQPATPPAAPPTAAPAAAPTATGGLTSEQIERLKELARLRDSGVLTEQEFQAEKQRILSG